MVLVHEISLSTKFKDLAGSRFGLLGSGQRDRDQQDQQRPDNANMTTPGPHSSGSQALEAMNTSLSALTDEITGPEIAMRNFRANSGCFTNFCDARRY